MHRGCSLRFTTKSMRGPKKKKQGEMSSSSMRTESKEERNLREAERERQRWRQRERETRETKGMWSSPSLCLAALWLKRRVPGERGGSRPAQSVLLLPWSPACRPQKHTAKPSGRPPFIAPGPPHRLQRICKASTDCHGTSSSQFRGRRSALDEQLHGSWRRFLMF